MIVCDCCGLPCLPTVLVDLRGPYRERGAKGDVCTSCFNGAKHDPRFIELARKAVGLDGLDVISLPTDATCLHCGKSHVDPATHKCSSR